MYFGKIYKANKHVKRCTTVLLAPEGNAKQNDSKITSNPTGWLLSKLVKVRKTNPM